MQAEEKKMVTVPLNVENRDGIEWLTFTYTSKGSSVEHTIRIDTESVTDDQLSSEFKEFNSVYPKANIKIGEYTGNRYHYETTVNEIGWKLSLLNPILIGKKGLLQRAVDRYIPSDLSFRNRFPSSQSRRVARVKRNKGNSNSPSASESTHSPAIISQFFTSNIPYVDNEFDLTLLPAPTFTRITTPKKQKKRKLAASSPVIKKVKEVIRKDKEVIHNVNKVDSVEEKYMTVNTVKNARPFEFKIRCDLDSTTGPQISNVPDARFAKCLHVSSKLALLNPIVLDEPASLQRATDVYIVQNEPIEFWPPRRRRMFEAKTAADTLQSLSERLESKY